MILRMPVFSPNPSVTRFRLFAKHTGWGVIFCALLWGAGCASGPAATFEVQRPAKLSVPREVRKIFIRSDFVEAAQDRIGLKAQVLERLAEKLNGLGRFEAQVVDHLDENSLNPEQETVAVIQGEVVSRAELDRGQFTDVATCTGGIGGRLSAIGAAAVSKEAITVDSWGGYICRKGNFKSNLTQAAFTQAFALAGLSGAPPKNQVVRTYRYRNLSFFVQATFSVTVIGPQRSTLAIRTDASQFSRRLVNQSSYQNVQEVHNLVVTFLGPVLRASALPTFPNLIRPAALAERSRPREVFYGSASLPDPGWHDLTPSERETVLNGLVEQSILGFVQTISPYRVKVEAALDSGGDAAARALLESGKPLDARRRLEAISRGDRSASDWYHLGLSYEAGAVSVEDYEDARRFYIEALKRSSGSRVYAQGVGRIERFLADYRKLRQQTEGR